MRRECDGTDLFLFDSEGKVGRCGATFDDVDHSTICPHPVLPPRMTEADLESWSKMWEKTR